MDKKQFIILLISVVISSFLGGSLIQLFVGDLHVFAKEPSDYFDVIKTKTIHLIGQNDKIRASFYLGIHDSPQLVLYDKNGTNRFNFGLAPAGNPGMAFNDENFSKILELDTKYSKASITLWGAENKIIWQVP